MWWELIASEPHENLAVCSVRIPGLLTGFSLSITACWKVIPHYRPERIGLWRPPGSIS
jgi:hypothetical protein